MPDQAQLPEVVRDFKLETEFPDDRITIHTTRWSRLNTPAREEWVQVKLLGRGGYGLVWLQKHASTDGSTKLRAVKEIKHNNSIDDLRELEALVKFSIKKYHGFFVQTYGWYESPTALFITMEYCEQGSLADYLEQNQTLPEDQTRQIAWQVLGGLELMHEEGFAHRDLKPANILIWKGPPEWWVKICDLGLTKRVQGTSESTKVRGTRGFIPPELMEIYGNPQDVDAFSADMWCYGESVFRMLTGQPTFPDERVLGEYLLEKTKFPIMVMFGREASLQAVDFLSSVMKPRPNARLKASEARNHPWFAAGDLDGKTDHAIPQGKPDRSVPIPDISTSAPPIEATGTSFPPTEATGTWSTKTQGAEKVHSSGGTSPIFQYPIWQPKTEQGLSPRHSSVSSRPSVVTHNDNGIHTSPEPVSPHRLGSTSRPGPDTTPKRGFGLRFSRMFFSRNDKKHRQDSSLQYATHGNSSDNFLVKPDLISYHDLPSSDVLHCSNFLDGTVFLYSRERIHAYYSTGDKFCSITPSRGVEWLQTVRPTSRSCTNEAILLLAKSRAKFRGIIYTVIVSNPPQIQSQHIYFEALSTAVEKAAFSPDGKMIALAVEPNESASAEAQVLLYQLQERRESSGSVLSSASEKSSTTLVAQRSILGNAGKVCGVQNTRDLFFSRDGQMLYHACLLKHDATSWTSQVQVNIFKTHMRDEPTKSPDWTCIIDDTNTEFRRFFMQGIIPFNMQTGFMYITHEDSIVWHVLLEGHMRKMAVPIQGVFRIRSVLLSSDDERVVMLATPNGTNLEVYGGPLGALEAPRKLHLSKKIRYYPEFDAAYLHEEAGKMELWVTSRNDKGTYMIDIRGLFDQRDSRT